MIVAFTAHKAFSSAYGAYKVDTDALIEKVGNKEYRYQDPETKAPTGLIYTVPWFRDLVKMILRYAEDEAVEQFDTAWSACRNEKLRKVWNDEKAKSKRYQK